MKKTYKLLILLIHTILLPFTMQKSLPDVKANEHTSILFESYQIFLPLISRQVLQGYFVSPNGNDTNPGILLQPWKSIGKAAEMIGPGDTVFIRGGIFNESVSFRTSGTESNPISIMAYPGENPIIYGGHTIPGSGLGLLNIIGDYIYVSGLEVSNSAYMGIYIYGNYDIVDNMYVHHNKENGILINHGHHSMVENSHIWRNVLSNEFGQANNWSTGLSAARHGVSYATIRHNVVWENWGEGISSFEADQIIMEDNIVHDSYGTNLYISDSTNVLCQRNFVYTDPDSYVFPYSDHGGIMMGDELYNPSSANIAVINNIAFGNQGNFWWWQGFQGGGMNNVLIANNTFVSGIGDLNLGRGGVIISEGDHQNVRFENNLVWQDGDLPTIATIDQPGIIYSHNLWSKPPYAAATGPGDVIGDPKLSKTGGPHSPEWFLLTRLSPAIDNALSIPEIMEDYFGFPRGSFPDIGAIEYFQD